MVRRISTADEPSIGTRDRRRPLLEVADVTVRFGGITALDQVSFAVERGQHRRPDRPERRRQDDAVQLPVAPLQLQRGADRVRGPLAARHAAARHRRARHRPHVPEPRALPDDERARERPARRPLPAPRSGFVANALRLPRVRREEAQLECRGRRAARPARPAARSRDARVMDLPFGTQKRVELGRALASRAEAAAARRAGRRPQPRGGRGADGLLRRDPRRSST